MKDPLHDLLQSWQPAAPESAAFRRNVWRRIAAAAPQTPAWERFLAAIARPRLALATVIAAMVLGTFVGAGWSRAAAASGYLRSVNPYAQVR